MAYLTGTDYLYGKRIEMNTKVVLLSLTLALFGSCNNDDDPDVDASPDASDISGAVFLYGEGISRAPNEGMTVTIENSNPVKAAITDSEGKFLIKDVPLGTHNLVFTKSGYGTFRLFDIVHVTDNRPTNITAIPSLGTVSTTQVTALTASVVAGEVKIEATTNPGGSIGNTRYVRLFMHNLQNVSDVFHTVYSPNFTSRMNPFIKTYTKAELNAMGFASGTTVYVRVYGDSYWSNQYDDPGLDRRVFPNLNPNAAAAVSFVVP
ncbi:MAG TPA: carboxypeptidase regulatory-like domain-containing protein [Cytophagales bacterium]|nr:carboxypeptidase regulatory-like domain-containing protein [Cytophagales bacterium]